MRAGSPPGWALIPDPSEKELRFCHRLGIEVVAADIPDLLAAVSREAGGETIGTRPHRAPIDGLGGTASGPP